MNTAAQKIAHDPVKWAFFALMALFTLLVIFVDEGFLLHLTDPYWKHIEPYKWLLLLHGVAGVTALAVGPTQFSQTLRRRNLKLHRWLGRVYIGAVFIAAPVALYIGVRFSRPVMALEQPAQAGLWFATTAIALICILNRNIPAHRSWMMKSYCFCLVFVISRVPDALPVRWTDVGITTFLWYLIVAALIGPDIVLTTRELWRSRTRKRA